MKLRSRLMRRSAKLFADNYVAGLTSINGGIETFCIQLDVGLQANPLDATWTPGGVAGGTSYLYRQFVDGTLTGYAYSPTLPGGSGNSARAQSALTLQMAIWNLQGFTWAQIEGEEGTAASAAQIAAAKAYVILGLANPGNYNVDALVLTGTSSATGLAVPSQDMLIAVPDGGSAVMLLGIAMGGLVMVSRKLRKA